MAAKSSKLHGFRVNATLFVAYDPAKPETVTAASEKLADMLADMPEGVIVEKSTPPAPASINPPQPAAAA